MATKINPGEYDCYSKLTNDEPYFVLRAKDRLAPILVRFWVQLALLLGNQSSEKCAEATRCATAMEEWKKCNSAT